MLLWFYSSFQKARFSSRLTKYNERKSVTWKFSLILSGWEDLAIMEPPIWRCQRSTTSATVLLYYNHSTLAESSSVVEPEPPFLAEAGAVKKGEAPAPALQLKLQV